MISHDGSDYNRNLVSDLEAKIQEIEMDMRDCNLITDLDLLESFRALRADLIEQLHAVPVDKRLKRW